MPGTAQLPSEEPFEFTVGPSNGFLPRHPPLDRLPSEFAALESLLNRMPVVLDNGQAGYVGALSGNGYDGGMGMGMARCAGSDRDDQCVAIVVV